MARLGRLSDLVDTVPDETILSKLEYTDYPVDDLFYNDYARDVLSDRSADKPFMQSEGSFKMDSRQKLNMRYHGTGSRYNKEPNHSELNLTDNTPDPRGSTGLPLFSQMRKHVTIRSKDAVLKMPVQSINDPSDGSGLSPGEQLRSRGIIQDSIQKRFKGFSSQFVNEVRGDRTVTDPDTPWRFIMDQEITQDIGQLKPDQLNPTYKTSGNLPDYHIMDKIKQVHIPGYDYVSMNQTQKGMLSKNMVKAARASEQQHLTTDSFVTANSSNVSTPADIARVYRQIQDTQLWTSSLASHGNKKSKNVDSDMIKANFNAGVSEEIILGPDGLIMPSRNTPLGPGGANRVYKDASGNLVDSSGYESKNQSLGVLPSNKSQVGISTPSHTEIYMSNALRICKNLATPNDRNRRLAMQDIQHAGMILGLLDHNDKLRLAKGMIPVINNHMLMKNSEIFVNNPAACESYESGNKQMGTPNILPQLSSLTDVNIAHQDTWAHQGNNITSKAMEQHKSKKGDFEFSTDIYNDITNNAGRTPPKSRIKSGFLRQTATSLQ